MENFQTLEDIFADEDYEYLLAEFKPPRLERVDPEIEKFLEIVNWVREHGHEPIRTTNLKERQLFSRLKGIRDDEAKVNKFMPYDELGLLGEVK